MDYLDYDLYTEEENIDWAFGAGWYDDTAFIDVDRIDKELEEENSWMEI